MKFYNWKKNTPRKNCINVMLIEWLLSHQFKCVSANAISCYGKNDSHRTKIYTCTIFKFKCFKTEEKEIKFKSIFSMFIVCLFVFFSKKMLNSSGIAWSAWPSVESLLILSAAAYVCVCMCLLLSVMYAMISICFYMWRVFPITKPLCVAPCKKYEKISNI